jgi:hypothetical protein
VRCALAVAERAGAERARLANVQRFKELLMDKGVRLLHLVFALDFNLFLKTGAE